MPELVWDKVGDRVYETGLDKGVLYLPDGSAVPWNGLTSIIEKFDRSTSPVYFDGMKINDAVVLGDFEATMKAVTYPDEFDELEALYEAKPGVFYADQPPQTFGLCYRTQVGNDVEGDTVGYKIHILYNVTAMPSDKTYATLSNDPSLVEFEWSITAVPEDTPGHRPTAHIILDTRKLDPILLGDLEILLYGSAGADASLIPMPELVEMIKNFFRLEVVDNGDGTWTATTPPELEDVIILGADEYFEIQYIDAWYWDDETYSFQSTSTLRQVPLIKIWDAGNGIWTAASDSNAMIVSSGTDMVTIYNATINVIDGDTYEIEDTPYDG